MDRHLLREKLYPLMVGAFRYIDHHIREGDDGMLHMPKARNPEYKGGVDTSYELSLTRWMCRAIIQANEDLDRTDPIVDRCRKVLANITPYRTHPAEGFLIAEDTRLERGHRHWSHLLMIYPLFEYNADSPPQERALAKRSADHWIRLTVKPDLSGARNAWPKFAAAGLRASLGAGDEAVRLLESGVDDIHRMTRNTFAREGGPIGEAPLLGARAMQDLVLQDHDGIIRVFPAVGDAWQNVVIHKFRADGGFLVSARRENGETQFVRVESTAGEPCRIRTSLPGTVRAYGPRDCELREQGGGVIEVDLRKGEWVILCTGEERPDLTISPVALPEEPNYWGAKR
jgi:hypothetical protein